MLKAIALALLFLVALIVEISFMRSLSGMVSVAPILFMTGIIVMHRSEPEYGPLWFFAAAILLPIFGTYPGDVAGYMVSIVASFFFAKKLFATRSVFALLGLGLTTYIVYSIIRLIVTLITMPAEIFIHFWQAAWGSAFLIIGLYLGYIIVHELERRFGARFYIR